MVLTWELHRHIELSSHRCTGAQATAIMDLVEEHWQDLVGEMPLKIVYPALEGHDWRTVTGFDPKNTRWSYHNGGSWPGENHKHKAQNVNCIAAWNPC